MKRKRAVKTSRARTVTDCIGSTPLFALRNLVGPADGELLVKWERSNPGGSIKDRPALHIVDAAERLGLLHPGSTIIESSSGNFGISLAMIGAARGYRVIVLVDSKTTAANLRVLNAFGAETIVVDEPDDTGSFHKTRIVMANQLAREIDGSFRPDQVFNLLNSQAHYRSTGPELLAECGDRLNVVVGTASSGGQLGGLSRYLHEYAPDVSVIGVDADGSAIFGGPSAPYLIPGVGLGWTPANLDLSLIDAAYKISAEDAFYACRVLARREGVLAGASSGAAIVTGLRYAIEAGKGSTVVCILSDGGDRYLDSVYDDDWLAAAGFELGELTVAQLRGRARKLTAAQDGGDLSPTVIPDIQQILDVPDSTAAINAMLCPEWTQRGEQTGRRMVAPPSTNAECRRARIADTLRTTQRSVPTGTAERRAEGAAGWHRES
jgi:cystathionine beta-synthase/cysteine synthase A